jgi:hypothetical protein
MGMGPTGDPSEFLTTVRGVSVSCRTAGVLVCWEDGEEGVRERAQGDPAGPGRVVPDPMLVQGGQALSGWEELLCSPS